MCCFKIRCTANILFTPLLSQGKVRNWICKMYLFILVLPFIVYNHDLSFSQFIPSLKAFVDVYHTSELCLDN